MEITEITERDICLHEFVIPLRLYCNPSPDPRAEYAHCKYCGLRKTRKECERERARLTWWIQCS